MNKLLMAMTLLMLFLPVASYSQTNPPFPPGWRAAEKSDYSAENLSLMNNRVPNHVKADFNGDGINDNAWILINETENKYGLFIFLSKKGGGYETVNLSEYRKETDKLVRNLGDVAENHHFKTLGDCSRRFLRLGERD